MLPRVAMSIAVVFVLTITLAMTSTAIAQPDLVDDRDIVVIGGGLMGSSTAWQLARAGQDVLLLEMQGETWVHPEISGDTCTTAPSPR